LRRHHHLHGGSWVSQRWVPSVNFCLILLDTSMFLVNVDMAFSQSKVVSESENVTQTRQEAFEPYQSAVDLWIDGTITKLKQAVQLLNKAIDIDPTFVEA